MCNSNNYLSSIFETISVWSSILTHLMVLNESYQVVFFKNYKDCFICALLDASSKKNPVESGDIMVPFSSELFLWIASFFYW